MTPSFSLLSRCARLSGRNGTRTNRRRGGGPRKAGRQPLCVELLEDRTVPSAVAPPNGLISWWTADNTANDHMGLNHATLSNGAGFAGGMVAEAFSFDGNDDNLQAPTAGLPTGSADRTIELWARIDQQVAGEAFFAAYGVPGSDGQAYALGTLSDGRLFVSTWGPAIFGPALQNGRWYHVAATNVGRSFKLYLDGVQVAAGDMDVNTPADSTFWMGRLTMTSIGDFRRLDGMVEEVTVYNRALTPGEIDGIFNAGSDGKIKNYIAADFPAVTEGANSTVTFTIRRVGKLTGQAVVDWTTADGTATAGADYVAASGQVVFQDGQSSKTVDVTVIGDLTLEPTEYFNLVLSTSTPGYAVGAGKATINDGVTISISDASVTEGDAAMRFTDTFVTTGSGGLLTPRHIAFGPDGKLYVAGQNSDAVHRYDATNGAFLDVVIPGSAGLDGAFALAFGPDGNLYAAGQLSNNVLRYNLANGTIDEFVTPRAFGLSQPKGMLFGPDGNLYISSTTGGGGVPGPHQVLRFVGPNGATPSAPLPAPGQSGAVFVADGSGNLSNPNGLAFGPDGSLYVANTFIDSVNRYDSITGAFIDVFIPVGSGGLDAPIGMLFRNGELFVAGAATDAVLVYDANTGAYRRSISGGGLDGPSGIEFDANGYLYVAGSVNHQVLRYAPTSVVAFTVNLSNTSTATVRVDYATANGSALAGGDYTAVSGTLTFAPGVTSRTVLVRTVDDTLAEPTETFTLNLSNSVGATIADATGVGTILDDETKFYVVNDAIQSATQALAGIVVAGPVIYPTITSPPTGVVRPISPLAIAAGPSQPPVPDTIYRYGVDGGPRPVTDLASTNSAPRGAASTSAGDKVWVVDANKTVYVYDANGALLGSWNAGSMAGSAQVEGITTDGTDIWLVDARSDRVFRYAGAASRLSGSQSAASSFNLNSSNRNPKDLVTNGVHLWVVNDSSDKVFKYTLAGGLVGSWTIDAANTSPTGITLDPADVRHLWIVDNATDRVYQYDDAAGRTSGSQSASLSFALSAGNTNPQGIADPPAPGTPAQAMPARMTGQLFERTPAMTRGMTRASIDSVFAAALPRADFLDRALLDDPDFIRPFNRNQQNHLNRAAASAHAIDHLLALSRQKGPGVVEAPEAGQRRAAGRLESLDAVFAEESGAALWHSVDLAARQGASALPRRSRRSGSPMPKGSSIAI